MAEQNESRDIAEPSAHCSAVHDEGDQKIKLNLEESTPPEKTASSSESQYESDTSFEGNSFMGSPPADWLLRRMLDNICNAQVAADKCAMVTVATSNKLLRQMAKQIGEMQKTIESDAAKISQLTDDVSRLNSVVVHLCRQLPVMAGKLAVSQSSKFTTNGEGLCDVDALDNIITMEDIDTPPKRAKHSGTRK